MKVMTRFWFELLALSLASCFSGSLLQEPTPLAPGTVRGALGIEINHKRRDQDVVPSIAARVGVAPRLELRGKYSVPNGGEVGLNVQALNSERVDLMLMPSFFDYDHDRALDENYDHTHLVGLELPAIVGVSIDRHKQFQLFAGPDLRVGKRNGAAWTGLGVHLGAAISGSEDHGTFIPECAFFQSFMGQKNEQADPSGNFLIKGAHTISCSLGMSVGHPHKR